VEQDGLSTRGAHHRLRLRVKRRTPRLATIRTCVTSHPSGHRTYDCFRTSIVVRIGRSVRPSLAKQPEDKALGEGFSFAPWGVSYHINRVLSDVRQYDTQPNGRAPFAAVHRQARQDGSPDPPRYRRRTWKSVLQKLQSQTWAATGRETTCCRRNHQDDFVAKCHRP